MSKLTPLTPPPGTDELFRQRLTPHADDVDGEQPYDVREEKVLREAIAWGLVDLYDAPSWYTLTQTLRTQPVPAGVEPALWIPFRQWALYVRGLPVEDARPEFNPAIYWPTGEPWPEGTVFRPDGQATLPPDAGLQGVLMISPAIADTTVRAEHAGLTIRQLVARLRGAG